MNEQEGLLQSWSIEFDVKECDYEYRWTELPSTNTSFQVPGESPKPDDKTVPKWKSRDIRQRYDHTAVSAGWKAVKNSLIARIGMHISRRNGAGGRATQHVHLGRAHMLCVRVQIR